MKRTRLKYFLRALGIGIIVATLLTGYSRRGQAQMTDEEILQRAAALGMTERQGTLLSDIANVTPRPTAEPVATPTAEPTAEPVATPTAEPTAAPTAEPVAPPTAEPTAAPTAEPTATPAEPTAEPTDAPAGDTVTLVITRGESSMTVSKNLQELGLVEDYKVYDQFLCDNRYDHYISAGTYEIPISSSFEEIAQIILKKR